MPDEKTPVPKSRGWVRVLIVFIVAFDVAAFFQWADGALQSEFGGHPDEAGHYLAGVRVRDAASHFVRRDNSAGEHRPMAALRRTPVFDVAEGAWMLAFGTSRLAVLLFMAAFAAATTTLIFCTVWREFGAWAAVVASLVWLCAPAVRESYETILPGQFFALAWTGAALVLARIVGASRERFATPLKWIRNAAVFGISFIFVWQLATALTGSRHATAWSFAKESSLILGVGAAAFAAAAICSPRRTHLEREPNGAMVTALFAVVLAAAWGEADYLRSSVLIIATPALAMLATRGAVSLARIVGSQTAFAAENSRRSALWLFLLLLLALPADLMQARQKEWSGFGSAAAALLEESSTPARVLVVSDPRGEGMLISEIALRDPAHRLSVERGSETLAESDDRGASRRAQERFLDDEQLFAHLSSGKIAFIVLDAAVPNDTRAGYHDQVIRVLEGNVRSFWPVFNSPVIRDGEPQGHPLRIFRVAASRDSHLQLQ